MGIEQNDKLEPSESINVTTDITSSDTSIKCDLLLSVEDKLSYAKKVLSEDQIDKIEESWVVSEGMTKEKLDIIGNDDLAIEQIIALGGENIAHELMTDQKLTVVGYMLSASDIERIGAKELAEMSIKELNSIV